MTKKQSYEPKFVANVRGGWSDASQRWMDRTGKFTTRTKAMNDTVKVSDMGGMVQKQMSFPTPISTSFETVEVVMSNFGDMGKATDENQPLRGLANVLSAAIGLAKNPNDKPMPNYMPFQMQTRMRLAEHFWATEGDPGQVVDVPIEMLSRKPIIDCSDKGLRSDVEDLLQSIGIEDLIGEMWRSVRVYGQAFPWEEWDGKELKSVIPLPPLHVHVGYNWSYTLSPEMYGIKEWNKNIAETYLPPAMFKTLVRHWNESPVNIATQGVPLTGEYLRPIRDRDFNWQRYAMPMLSKGFRDLTSRIVYEDAIRAVTEGYRYQFWVIKLGDAEHPPLPEEIGALKAVLGASSGERTSMLVWRDSPLTVEVHVPAGLDQLLGGDYLGYLTKQFYRKMGITTSVVSGEMPGVLGSVGRGGGGGSNDLDVQIFIERCRYQANQMTRWIWGLVESYLKRSSATGIRTWKKSSVRFTPTTVEVVSQLKDVFSPMYETGALSHRTYVGVAGLNQDAELANKKNEKEFRDDGLLSPPMTYVQGVMGGDGVQTTEQTQPKGSPDELGELKNRVKKKKSEVATPIKKKVQGGTE